MSADSGNTAFPVTDDHGANSPHIGMMLRDYFASDALKGIITHAANPCTADAPNYAKCAYAYADAMLSERAK